MRKILNKLATMILKDSLDQFDPPIQSVKTEGELKRAVPAHFEHMVNIKDDKEAQKRSLPSSSSALTDNDLGNRRISYFNPGSINRTEGYTDDLNLLFRNRMSSHASGSAHHIYGSTNNLNRLPRWTEITKETKNDLITMTSDRGTHYDLLPLDTETSGIVEKGRRNKKKSLTTVPRQILSVEEQTNRFRKQKGGCSFKNTQAAMTNTIFKRSDFEDNRFKKIDEIEIHDGISDGIMYEINSDGQDNGMSNKEKVVTLANIIRDYQV